MRVTGIIREFTPEQTITTKDGRELKKRTIVIDAGYQSESGTNITQVFVAQTFKEYTDEQLMAWKQRKAAFYVFFDVRQYEGRYFQDVSLSNINEL